VITSEQVRVARALLRLTAQDVANSAGVGLATIRRIEAEDGVPSSNAKILVQIQAAYERLGVIFVGSPQDGPGV
jgi:DNA-binding XRE family transcriptional regulator